MGKLNLLDERVSILYDRILDTYISRKKLSLTEISNLSEEIGQRITVSYLSKLKNGKMPPPSYKVSLVLAKILGIRPQILLGASQADQDEYDRVELLNALKWAYPDLDEEEINKIIIGIFQYRFHHVNGNDTLNLIKQLVLSQDEIHSTDEKPTSVYKVPVFSKIVAGDKSKSTEYIKDWIYEGSLSGPAEQYFFFIVNDNSRLGNRILKGDKALIHTTTLVSDGDIVLVNLSEEEGVLRKIKRIPNGQFILFSDTPECEPIVVSESGVRIYGKVIKVIFSID